MQGQVKSNMKLRPPIVTVLGHVDHGKTSLLDRVRNTSVASSEAGGITQRIGASVVKVRDKEDITFIDTPGHAAFSYMRMRGVKVADICILVVSATDGVMPQTREALEYIQKEKIPFIVAASKIDLPTADVEMVKRGLEKEGVLLEGSGGDVPIVPISSKTGQGIDDLLDMILLLSEINEIKGDPDGNLDCFVFESGKDKRGCFASVVVRNGTLSVGDEVVCDGLTSKIRGIFDDKLKGVSKILPGYPGQLIGFDRIPAVGSKIWRKGEGEIGPLPAQPMPKMTGKFSKDEIGIFIKAKNAGALEAITSNLPAGVVVVDSGIGDVTESDVLLSKSMGIDIYAFESKAHSDVIKLAEAEGVRVNMYDVVYELFEDLRSKVQKKQVSENGRAEIVAVFPFDDKQVAGCRVISGKISRNDDVIVARGALEIGRAKISSLKRNKNDVNEVHQGEEFGALLTPQLDFTIGDSIISIKKQ